MGFGVALFGYAFLLMHEIGGALIGAVLLAYGFFLASRVNKNFLNASVSVLFMLPRGVFQICAVLGFVSDIENPMLNTVTFLLFLIAWMIMSFFWLIAVAQIARDCKAEKLEQSARIRLVLTTVFIGMSICIAVLSSANMLGGMTAAFSAVQYILQYVIIIMNILFLHTCFVMITSEKQYELDRQELAKERARTLEQQHREHQEVQKRIEKRKKK